MEIGKRDIFSAAAVAAERPDVAYGLVAVDFMSEVGLHAAMLKLSQPAASGSVMPLPGVVHDMLAVVAAVRQMSQVG